MPLDAREAVEGGEERRGRRTRARAREDGEFMEISRGTVMHVSPISVSERLFWPHFVHETIAPRSLRARRYLS